MEHKLVKIGREKFIKEKDNTIPFLPNTEMNELINDLDNTPHAFVLACLMDRQVKAERAWSIPYYIKNELGTFDIHELANISLEEYIRIFEEKKLHRFNETMAKCFFDAIHRILNVYDGDVSKIWKDKPSSAKVVYEFLQFNGAGIKIATMIANILARDFKIPYSDYYSIDISPDIHITRIMKRNGLVSINADIDSIIYKAREMCPEYPGIIDEACWEIGRTWCHPSNPNCNKCILTDVCKKAF